MIDRNIILACLGIQDEKVWTFDSVIENGETHIYLNLKDERIKCPYCQNDKIVIKDYYNTTINNSIIRLNKVFVHIKMRRYLCKTCRKTFRQQFFLGKFGRSTSFAVEMSVMESLKKKVSFKDVAEAHNISVTQCIRIFDESNKIERLQLTRAICVDEFFFGYDRKGDAQYPFIIVDPNSTKIIDILPSRHQYYLEQYLSKIPQNERLRIKIVNIDMWEAYKTVFSNYCWNAKIAVDPFHWIGHATDNFHKLRRIVEEQIDNPKVKTILRSDWKLFSLKEEKLSTKRFYSKLLNRYISNREKVEYCVNSDSRLEIAWSILQEIYKFRDKCTVEKTSDELIKIIEKLENTKLFEMITIAKTYRHWFTEICNSFLTYGPYNKKTSNAFIEGKNRLCKEIKAFSCGFNNFAIYRARILYISSDGMIPFKKGDNKRRLYQKNKKK